APRTRRASRRRAACAAASGRLPAALVPCERLDVSARQLVGEPEPVQDPRGVRADLDPGADLGDRRRLLVYLHVETGRSQRQRRREPADPGTDDGDAHQSVHRGTPNTAVAIATVRNAPCTSWTLCTNAIPSPA